MKGMAAEVQDILLYSVLGSLPKGTGLSRELHDAIARVALSLWRV